MKRKPAHRSRSPSWYSVADLAALFDVSERCIWRWVQQGKLPPPVRKGLRWSRWNRRTIDKLIRQMDG